MGVTCCRLCSFITSLGCVIRGCILCLLVSNVLGSIRTRGEPTGTMCSWGIPARSAAGGVARIAGLSAGKLGRLARLMICGIG